MIRETNSYDNVKSNQLFPLQKPALYGYFEKNVNF